MYKTTLLGIAGAAALTLAALPANTARAGAVADFYKGKTVTIVYGFSPGGTYGKYAQMMSRHLQRHIPGKPNIISQSMPGAGGTKATNYAYTILPKNGTALLMPPDSIIVSQLLRPKGVRYKANEFTWLGNLIESNSIVVVRADAGVKSLADIVKKQVIMSSTGKGSQTFLVPSMLNGVFGTRFKIVMGYKGSAGSMLAMEQGETQGVSLTWLAWKTNRPQWFDNSQSELKGIPVVQIGFQKEQDLPNVDMARDLAKNAEDRQIVDFMASLGPIGRGLAAVPGVPRGRVMALRAAFKAMSRDRELLAEAKKRNLRIKPKSGEEVQKIVNDVLKMSPAVIKRARKLIMGG